MNVGVIPNVKELDEFLIGQAEAARELQFLCGVAVAWNLPPRNVTVSTKGTAVPSRERDGRTDWGGWAHDE